MTRRFLIFADVRDSQHVEEFDDSASEEEIEEVCKDSLDILIGNGDTGWIEITEEDWLKFKKFGRID